MFSSLWFCAGVSFFCQLRPEELASNWVCASRPPLLRVLADPDTSLPASNIVTRRPAAILTPTVKLKADLRFDATPVCCQVSVSTILTPDYHSVFTFEFLRQSTYFSRYSFTICSSNRTSFTFPVPSRFVASNAVLIFLCCCTGHLATGRPAIQNAHPATAWTACIFLLFFLFHQVICCFQFYQVKEGVRSRGEHARAAGPSIDSFSPTLAAFKPDGGSILPRIRSSPSIPPVVNWLQQKFAIWSALFSSPV